MFLLRKLSLIQKIFLLVFLPIFLELGFLAAFGTLLENAEKQVAQEVRLNKISTSLDDLVRHLYSSGTELLAFVLTDNNEMLERYKKNRSQAAVEMDKITALTAGDPAEAASAAKIRQLSQKIAEVLDASSLGSEVGGSSWRFMKTHKLNKQLQKLSSDLLLETDHLKELEKSKHNRQPGRAKRIKQDLKLMIWIAAAVNVLLAGLLALWISKDMVARLKLLMTNASRISSAETLPAAIEGTDEISQLDKTLHLVAEELAAADRKRVEVEKLRSDFVSMIGHDLRSPLTVVQASLNDLSKSNYSGENSDLNSRLSDTALEIERLVRLTEELLDVSLINSTGFKIEQKSLESWILIEQAIRATAAAAAEKKISIKRPDLEITVNCDQDRIVQVLVNLLLNAIEASPENSQINIGLLKTEKATVFSVSDSGPGLTDEMKERVFEKFTSFSKQQVGKRSGLGLGLAVCRSIVLGHGGDIGVKNADGGGACFWFSLP
ncbi:MAG: CHASE3 domain-containing protein [Candidatus Obscuribacterales bacterium]|nr:CHASE3 domain-containing protein [Candidatus Obscuribacterales bacterium]